MCCATLAATGLDLILGGGWLEFAAFTIGLPLFVHLLATASRLSVFWRILLTVTVPAFVGTLIWQWQVESGDYRITIGPEIVFIGSLLQFTLGCGIIEGTLLLVTRYQGKPPLNELRSDDATEPSDGPRQPE